MASKQQSASAFNPLSVLAVQDIPPICLFNTASMYDLQSGDLQRGYDGNYYIRGGLGSFITAILGRGNSFKSTFGDSLVTRVLAIYRMLYAGIYDSETIKDMVRIIRCAGELSSTDLDKRIDIRSQFQLGELWNQLQDICEYKEKNQASLMIETPFVDPRTDKRLVCWIPTIIFIDSLTETRCRDEVELLKDGLDDKSTTRANMIDGLKKSIFLRHLRPLCERYGICIVLTGAIGDNGSLDPMAPPQKQLPFMKQRDHTKGTSNRIATLPRNSLQVTKCAPLLAPDKTSLYPYGNTPPTDVVSATIGLQRGKNNSSGTYVEYVMSQTDGLLNDVTNYHHLRSNGYFGLVGSNAKHQPAFFPEVSVSRNTFREISSADAKVRRAIELAAHLLYVKQNYNFPPEIQAKLALEPEALFDALQKGGSARVDKVLASRSYWTPETTDRPYMSIIDVVRLLEK